MTDQEHRAAALRDPAAGVIAVVEDQDAILELIVDVLRDGGFEPVGLASARVAAQRIAELRPRVVLLDVMMAELSGWDVLDQLRADPATRDIPVLITSAVYDRPGLRRLPPGGPVRFVPKPFDIGDLLAAVTALADGSAP